MTAKTRMAERGDVDPFLAMDVFEAASQAKAAGRDIVHMEVGQPSHGAPKAAREKLARDLAASPLGYTVALGLPELRARIARAYGDWYNIDLDPARVIVTSGASGAFTLAFTALFEEGAKVGLGMPCYPSYRQILRALGQTPVALPTTLENRFQPTPDQVAGLDGLIIASPGNPTGSMLTPEALGALYGACRDAGTALISDEIYHRLTYGQPEQSALAFGDDVFVINSFSKFFALTGWRIGWLVVPEAQVRRVERLAQNLFICPAHASQKMALYAMDEEAEMLEVRQDYARARNMLLEALPTMGLSRIAPPDGAFYVYADVSHLTDDSTIFAHRILDEVGVSVTPGLDFDPVGGHGWLRFSYAAGSERVAEGISRLSRFFGANG